MTVRQRCPFSNDASEGCKWRSPIMHDCSRRFYAGRIPIVPECAQRVKEVL